MPPEQNQPKPHFRGWTVTNVTLSPNAATNFDQYSKAALIFPSCEPNTRTASQKCFHIAGMASNKRKAGGPGEGRPQNYLRSGTLTYASPADAAETGSDPHRIIIAEDLVIGVWPDPDCDNAHNPPKIYAKRKISTSALSPKQRQPTASKPHRRTECMPSSR